MDQAVHAPDYLRGLKADWLIELRAEVIEPIRAKAVAHPFIAEVAAGTFPVHKLRRFFADLCWTVITTPGVVASLAARTPHYEHPIKTKLLENAYTEWNHAWALSQTVNALGGPGDRIFNGPETAWEALPYAWHLRNWQLLYAYNQPWLEGIAAFAVGIEALVPSIIHPLWKGCERHYGLRDEALDWLVWHGGEVEMQHGNDGLFILEQKVPADDRALQAQLRSVVHKTMLVLGEHWLDYYYRADDAPAVTAA
jgi:pyrroloquinoline quinone (PQQ) biosynthesis protein C